ncbi:glycosyltransferase [Corynebacterium suedekumii]|nr:glycosyltransferase [Corynebacterium suedekumii]
MTSSSEPSPPPRNSSRDEDGTEGAGRDTYATVIVCTLGKNPILPLTIRSLLAQTHRHLEVIVVDNAPASGDTRRQLAGCADPRLRIVDEPHAGLSRARNAGLAAAAGEVVAFTDDDALPGDSWLASILDVFASAPPGEVGGVTGPAFAAELQSPSQRYFEARGGFPRGLAPVVWSLADPSGECARFGERGDGGPLFPSRHRPGGGGSLHGLQPAGDRRPRFLPTCGWAPEPAPTVGRTWTRFARILRAGFAIVYNPDAVVHHVHRRDLPGLERQIHGNGTGMAALLTKTLLQRPGRALDLLARIPRILRRVAPNSERMKGATMTSRHI